MKKCSGIIRQDTAVGFYRIVQPLRFIKREGLAYLCRMTFFSGDNVYGENSRGELSYDDDMLKKICHKSDIIWTNFTAHHDDMLRMLDLRKWTGAKLIVDVDDNIYNISQDNPVKDRASKLKYSIELSLKIADGVTVSVPSLKELYKPLNDNIFVNPNGIDFKIWRRNLKPHKGIRIGWEGAFGHRADLELVYPAMKKLIEKYDVTFVVFGVTPEQGLSMPDFPIEYHDWVGFSKYPKKLADLQLDILVAPLIDSSYNRCKSNLRILENSALKIPIVASPVENQKNMPLYYASSNYEWYEQLEILIKDKKTREKQGQIQNEFIREHYDMKTLIHPVTQWMDKLPRRTDLEP